MNTIYLKLILIDKQTILYNKVARNISIHKKMYIEFEQSSNTNFLNL